MLRSNQYASSEPYAVRRQKWENDRGQVPYGQLFKLPMISPINHLGKCKDNILKEQLAEGRQEGFGEKMESKRKQPTQQ